MISADALVAYAEELEDTTEGSGLAWLRARREEALAKITGGGGSQIISTTVNGQTFMRRIDGTAQDWFEVLTWAIRDLSGTRAKVTYARIPCPPH